MAEFVQKRLEDLLPELEQLERVQLFTKEEVRAVIKRRKEFEYRLQRKQKSAEDYTRYIEYERNLLQLIWKRRERLGYAHKKAEIDQRIVARIQQLYRIVCIRFNDDASLFLSQVEFCKQMKQFAAGSRVFTRLLRTQAHKPELWVAAATYEMEDNNSSETARQLMLRALRLHPECAALWTASFRLELKYVQKLRERQNLLGVEEVKGKLKMDEGSAAEDDAEADGEEPEEKRKKEGEIADPVLECGIARVVALQSLERLPEADPKADPCRLLTSLLAACCEFDFTADLDRELRDTFLQRFPERALTYDTLARAELAGGRVPTKLRTRLQLSSELYEQGLTEAPADEVYPLYLSSLVEVARSAPRHRHLVLPRLSEVVERAQSECSVSEESFVSVGRLYLEIGMAERAAVVMKTATDVHTTSAELWKLRIEALSESGDADSVCAAFEASSVAVPDSSAGVGALWLHVLQWASAHRPDYVAHVFSAAAARGAAVLRPLKPAYLRWLAASCGLTAAREMFDQHHIKPPIDAELFTAMAELELEQNPVDVNRLRLVYRAAVRHCGTDSAQMWLNYTRFERERGDPAQATDVYRLAVKSLTPEEADVFVAQHALMVANLTDAEHQ